MKELPACYGQDFTAFLKLAVTVASDIIFIIYAMIFVK